MKSVGLHASFIFTYYGWDVTIAEEGGTHWYKAYRNCLAETPFFMLIYNPAKSLKDPHNYQSNIVLELKLHAIQPRRVYQLEKA